MNWDQATIWLKPIESIAKYKSKWVCVCSSCQNERFISYGQARNVLLGLNARKCKACLIKDGDIIINVSGLKLGNIGENKEKSIKNRTGIKRASSKKYMELQNTFNPFKLSEEGRKRKRELLLGKTGKNTPAYKNGSSNERKLAHNREDYKNLRKSVFNRDNFTCQLCNKRGGYLEMDHIKEWCNYPELRFDINNCRTLCSDCHKKTNNFGSKARKIKCL